MSTPSWPPAPFDRLARAKERPRVEFGSPAAFTLTWAGSGHDLKTIPAIMALTHRRMKVPLAKRTIEILVEEHRAFAVVPMVESIETLTAELAAAGVKAVLIPREPIDVAALRARLQMTQEEFALQYGLELDAVRNWEHGRRTPDTAAQSYLRTISANPKMVEQALWATAPSP